MNEKLLFLTFVPISPSDGISKKILSQVDSLRKLGYEVYLSKIEFDQDSIYFIINDKVVKKYPNNGLGKLNLYLLTFNSIYRFCKENRINKIYIRHFLFTSGFLLHFIKKFKKTKDTKVFLEIPTYPYDGERDKTNLINLIKSKIDKQYRMHFHFYIDRIVTFSLDKEIWNCKTIQISNAVNPDLISLKREAPLSGVFHMIGVAVLAPWHGFDRVLYGIHNYNKNKTSNDKEVIFHICGIDPKGRCFNSLKQLSKELSIENNVIFHGSVSGKSLDDIFDIAHLGIGSLGRHRNGILSMRSLKNIEYATRGIPFIYSENNPDFDNSPYVLKVMPNEEPVDIKRCIDFYINCNISTKEIRESAKDYCWDNQMQKVRDEFEK